jgi:hypothetical protein
VVTSDRPVLAEAAGGAALLADPVDVAAIARQLERLLDDRWLAADLVKRGQEHARAMTWARTAAITRRAYAKAAGKDVGAIPAGTKPP